MKTDLINSSNQNENTLDKRDQEAESRMRKLTEDNVVSIRKKKLISWCMIGLMIICIGVDGSIVITHILNNNLSFITGMGVIAIILCTLGLYGNYLSFQRMN
jgi:hypothetical protein